MFALSPKSTIATSGSPASSPTSRTADGDTWATKSWSSQRGTARARSTAASWSVTPGSVITPRRQPFARRWRARARVSTPAMAGMPLPRSSVASWRASSRTAAVAWATTRPAEPRPFGLVVVAQPAVVADQRVGHHDDLARVRGIGGDLLVAGLRGVDDEVAARGRPGRRTRCPGTPCRPRARGARDRRRRRGDRRASRRGAAADAERSVGRSRGPGWRAGCRGGARRASAACGHAHEHLASYPASQDRKTGLSGPAIRMPRR